MLPLRRILHSTDLSSCAEGALAYALELAVQSGAELHVLHVLEGAPRPAASPDPMRPAEAGLDIRLRETVNAQLGRLDRAALEHLRIEYSLGRDVAPGPAIVRYADTHRIDLVVIGTHGRRGLRRLLLGSVATEVLHESSCDVLTVRTCEETLFEQPWGTHILVPLDLAESSAHVLREASALADLLEARVTLLHVIEPPPWPVFSAGQGGTFDKLMPELRQAAWGRLEHVREEAGLPAHTGLHVDEGAPARVIADVAQAQDIDLIVLASRSGQGIKHALLGSVAERVIRRAASPVWVLRPYAREAPEETTYMAAEQPEVTT